MVHYSLGLLEYTPLKIHGTVSAATEKNTWRLHTQTRTNSTKLNDAKNIFKAKVGRFQLY